MRKEDENGTVIIGHIKERMPRKSARLIARSRIQYRETNGEEQPSKRKRMEEVESRNFVINQRRQQFRIQNQWMPISLTTAITSSVLVPAGAAATIANPVFQPPQSSQSPVPAVLLSTEETLGFECIQTTISQPRSLFRFQNHFLTPAFHRLSPLPELSWGDSNEIWQAMLLKEDRYRHSHTAFDRHPLLQPRMRGILLEWLMEVCEVYRLHKETYYLAVDYFDRYLLEALDVQKSRLQLIGITALFIAAKVEEIYPPKVADFAFVTDGACTEEEIIDFELTMLKALHWELSPMTANTWLSLYLQLDSVHKGVSDELKIVHPHFSAHLYLQSVRLLDLCFLDIESLKFKYSVLAAAALHHVTSASIVLSVSGLQWGDLLPCVQWMAAFVAVLRDVGPAVVKFFPNVSKEDAHTIQIRSVDLAMLDRVQALMVSGNAAVGVNVNRSSPEPSAQTIMNLTPPASNKKTMTYSSGQHEDDQTENSMGC